VDPGLGPNPLPVGKAGQPVELTLRRGGTDRRAVVVPLASEHAVRYYDLVVRQRSAVRDASGGRLGYLRISGMSPAGWGVDNYGVEPDVEVTIAPHDWAAGRDPQLDTAVRLALQALEQRPAATPPTL
jgi:C-terminal processing protease CtpA/Prc